MRALSSASPRAALRDVGGSVALSELEITELPNSTAYRQVVQRRIDLIEDDRNIRRIERPEYKRRWNSPKWNDLEQAALRDWLLARLELPRYWPTSAEQPPQLTSTSRLADVARLDADFMQMAALYAGHADLDPGQLVSQLVASEAAPLRENSDLSGDME